jgi:tRNA-uridine 2-sulfurtransferase
MNQNKTVFVGMSGGVDSSVSALRLKKQGYNVVGVFIKVWHPEFMICNWEQERLDAMRVAAHLGIPFLTCDAEAEYRDLVARYFIDEYKAGRTPNPDVMCNKEIKFGAFFRFAEAYGADYIATGHYAQRKDTALQAELYRGIDPSKDQTYFLWTLTRTQLKKILFPIGDTQKESVRAEAVRAKLPVATKKDSQGICFLGHVDVPDFISHYATLVPGEVRDVNGNVLGTHRGAFVYTLGQRHGFTLHNSSTNQQPHYVISRNIEENVITVDTTKPQLTNSSDVILEKCNLHIELVVGMTLEAQFRYRQSPFLVTVVSVNGNSISIKALAETEKPAGGQSCVLYQGARCIGGGIIA